MYSIVLCVLCLLATVVSSSAKAPNIIFIVADDLGWNDVSLNGSPQIGTPNIDALGKEGVILNNYYAYSICSPSRATFLTGRHVMHTGMYSAYTFRTKNGYLNTSFTTLPQYLKSCCGYSTHLVGKWHLGLNMKSVLPTSRGFDTSLGYWFGVEDHFRHRIYGAYDFAEGTEIAAEYNGTWSTPLFTERAIEIIKQHANDENPFFLYLSYQDVHWPLQAPEEFVNRYEDNTGGSIMRKFVCAMAAHLDEGIGNLTRTLTDLNLWENTLVVFTSDNGGPTNGDELTHSNNYPLRGGKNTLWEGGNRVVGLVRGAGIQKKNYINNEKIYATDWLPSLVRMASGNDWTHYIPDNEPPFQLGDGLDVWNTLSTGAESPRDWILIEAHPPNATERYHGDALIVGDWKIVKYVDTANNKIENGWFVPPGEDASHVTYSVNCGAVSPSEGTKNKECQYTWCLFNLKEDPCELTNVAAQNPLIVQRMVDRLSEFQATAVEDGPYGCDPVMVTVTADGGKAWRPCDMVDDSHQIVAAV